MFYGLVEDAKAAGERPTAAFPSSHVGIATVCMLLAAHTRQRKLVLLMLPFYIFLCFSTVYIQAHYAIDALAGDYSIGVITNDIYTKEDAQFLAKNSVLPVERIIGVETGGCPHTAIREDASMNLEAVDEMMERFPDIQILFIESGGDNLSATFSPELVDATVFVIDVAEGDKIPRKGGPGITRSDLLVINKIDLAPYVGASLEVMDRDSRKMRGERPFVFTNIRGDEHVDTVVEWIKKNVLLEDM